MQLYRDSCIVSVVERWCVADRRRLEELAGDSENGLDGAKGGHGAPPVSAQRRPLESARHLRVAAGERRSNTPPAPAPPNALEAALASALDGGDGEQDAKKKKKRKKKKKKR